MSESWLEKFERELSRKTKVKKELRQEIEEKIEQLRLLEQDIEATVKEALSTEQPSREDVEWDLLNERLNGDN